MRSTRTLGSVLGGLVLAGMLAATTGCTDDGSFRSLGRPVAETTVTGAAPADGPAPSWDMVVRAAGTTVIDGVGPFAGTQLLLLDDVDPSVVAFTDRPRRLAGTMRLDEFLRLWHGGTFGTDPPNAVLQLGGDLVAVELAAATLDPARDRMVVAVRSLPAPGGRPGARLPVGAAGAATLFVDAVTGVAQDVDDDVAQTDVAVLGDAPAAPMSDLYQTVSSSVGLAAENATADPSSVYVGQQTTDQAIPLDLSVDTAAPAPGELDPGGGLLNLNGVMYSLSWPPAA